MKKNRGTHSNLPGILRVRRQPIQKQRENQELPGFVSAVNNYTTQALALIHSAFLTLLLTPFLLIANRGERIYIKLKASGRILSPDVALIASVLLVAIAAKWQVYDEAFQQIFPQPNAGFWKLGEFQRQPFQFRLKPHSFCNQLTKHNEMFEYFDIVLNWRYAFLEEAPVLEEYSEYSDSAFAKTVVQMPRELLGLACQRNR